ncbi:MAG: hypothetical protein IJX28_02720 [Clostridia bacterium]|nr:hypothetical protein [Clostridia bacterium]
MSKQPNTEKKANYSLPVRILCIALAGLLCSGILVYLAMMVMELFAK